MTLEEYRRAEEKRLEINIKHMENAGFYDPSGMSVLDVFNGLKF